ncbi:hypothetical protein Isop_2233 [Isosphaera pallida ATCC 43644]|uniref:Uncharacterized protein n=2 Tax=Isosphaera pallida TaxID=128 RepID=E8R5Q4_ISOPI|nr:hypothetical protein Isop_2233 [Isosphaera pallida ATCC 43644]
MSASGEGMGSGEEWDRPGLSIGFPGQSRSEELAPPRRRKRPMSRWRMWIRRVMPNDGRMVTVLVLALGFELYHVTQEIEKGISRFDNAVRGHVTPLPLLGLTLIWGAQRAARFHPFYWPDYSDWLRLTPWRPGNDPPWGPIRLVAQDLLLLGLWAGLVWGLSGGTLHPFKVVSMFLLGYLGMSVPPILNGGAPLLACLTLFGLGGIIRVYNDPHWMLGVAVGTALVAHLGQIRALRQFPWTQVPTVKIGHLAIRSRPDPARVRVKDSNGETVDDPEDLGDLGYPLEQLRPLHSWELKRMPVLGAVLVSALVAWWFHVAAIAFGGTGQPLLGPLTGFYVHICLGILLVRTLVYFTRVRPPITLGGRLRTGRFLQLRYDVALLPLPLIVVTAVSVPLVGQGLAGEVLLPAALGLTWFVGLACPPTLAWWRLAGSYRFDDTAFRNANSDSRVGDFVKTG